MGEHVLGEMQSLAIARFCVALRHHNLQGQWCTTSISHLITSMSFPVPLILEPSGVWAGADGNWSTWSLQVGTPPQQFNVLPSTSHGEVWIPVTEGCSWLPSTIDCGKLRGIGSFQGAQSLGFQDNSSTTWDPIGIYELSVGSDLFNTSESGLYGLDTVSFDNNVSIPEQIIAGIATQDFWLGSMGLNQQSSDFPVLNENASSLLDKMKAQNHTPSVSFSLAVGASYGRPLLRP